MLNILQEITERIKKISTEQKERREKASVGTNTDEKAEKFEELLIKAQQFKRFMQDENYPAYREFLESMREMAVKSLVHSAKSSATKGDLNIAVVRYGAMIEVIDTLFSYPEKIINTCREELSKADENA